MAGAPGNPPGQTLTMPVTTANVQSALDALVGAGNSLVSGTGPFTITFQGTLAAVDVPPLTVSTAVLGNEVQTLTFPLAPTSGTFVLSNGTTTSTVTIPASPTAANVTTAIQTALTAIYGSGNATVAQPASLTAPFNITFVGTNANKNMAPVIVLTSSLAPAGANLSGMATTTNGGAGVAEVQTLTFPAAPSSGTFVLSKADGTAQTTVTIPASPTPANVQAVIQAALNTIYGSGTTSVSTPASLTAAFVITFQGSLGTTDVAQTVAIISNLSPANANLTGIATTTDGALGTLAVTQGAQGSSIALTTAGAGRLELSGANSYTGATTISAGRTRISNATALGTTQNPTVVSNNATMEVGAVTVVNEGITVTGPGFGNRGAIVGLPGVTGTLQQTAALLGTGLTLTGATTIGVDTGGTLDISGVIGGNQSLTKLLPGTLRFSGGTANTNNATTTVAEGTLNLNKTVANGAIVGTLVIGNGLGDSSGLDRVTYNNTTQQIGDGIAVTIDSAGQLSLGTTAETLGALTLNDGVSNSASITGGTITPASIATAASSAGLGGNALSARRQRTLLRLQRLPLAGWQRQSRPTQRASRRTTCKSTVRLRRLPAAVLSLQAAAR